MSELFRGVKCRHDDNTQQQGDKESNIVIHQPDSLYCAYPSLTLHHRAMASTASLHQRTFSASCVQALLKYRSCGFRFISCLRTLYNPPRRTNRQYLRTLVQIQIVEHKALPPVASRGARRALYVHLVTDLWYRTYIMVSPPSLKEHLDKRKELSPQNMGLLNTSSCPSRDALAPLASNPRPSSATIAPVRWSR